MRAAVDFQDERLELEIAADRLVAVWRGPDGIAPEVVPGLVLEALENPLAFPPLRQAVVPGDRAVIAIGPGIPHGRMILEAIAGTLHKAGVDAGDVTVLVRDSADLPEGDVPAGASLVVHDPEDRAQLAYLSTTSKGRRIYLNRLLAEADVVVPVGRIGYDPVLGYQGPWSVIFPGLSNLETWHAFRAEVSDEPPDREQPRPSLIESTEVAWLLGCQFHVGVVVGATGLSGLHAGLESAVRDRGIRQLDRDWSFKAESRAETVAVGIGRPGERTTLDDLGEGLATAVRLVQRGGKIIALSRAEGAVGPALRRLIDLDDPRLGLSSLRGKEGEPDYPAARQLARALAWADVYLLSSLGSDLVEDLAMIPLDRPEEARRLIASAGSCLVVSQADLTRADVAEELDR